MRLGLRMLRGLAHDAAVRIVAARRERAFADTRDLAARARLDTGALRTLAAGGALATLAGHRRQALWQASGAAPLPGLLADAPGGDVTATLEAPAEAEDLLADYARLGFTELTRVGPDADVRQLAVLQVRPRMPHGQGVRRRLGHARIERAPDPAQEIAEP